jgi:hypothetical protein
MGVEFMFLKERLKELGVVVWGTVLVVVIGGLLAFGGLGIKSTVGTKSADVDRKIFENTTSYVKGMADDLAKYKYELSTTEDEVSRKAIIDLIIDKYADFDENKLDNPRLKKFLEDVKNGNIK